MKRKRLFTRASPLDLHTSVPRVVVVGRGKGGVVKSGGGARNARLTPGVGCMGRLQAKALGGPGRTPEHQCPLLVMHRPFLGGGPTKSPPSPSSPSPLPGGGGWVNSPGRSLVFLPISYLQEIAMSSKKNSSQS